MEHSTFMLKNEYRRNKKDFVASKHPENSYYEAEYTVVFIGSLVVWFGHVPSPKKSQ
jgi:hypothetical protein